MSTRSTLLQDPTVYLVAIGWMYVVLMMAAAELTSPVGSVLGALMTIVLYGLLPVSLLLYLMGTPMRAKARRKREQADAGASASLPLEPDAGSHPAGDTVPPVGKES